MRRCGDTAIEEMFSSSWMHWVGVKSGWVDTLVSEGVCVCVDVLVTCWGEGVGGWGEVTWVGGGYVGEGVGEGVNRWSNGYVGRCMSHTHSLSLSHIHH